MQQQDENTREMAKYVANMEHEQKALEFLHLIHFRL